VFNRKYIQTIISLIFISIALILSCKETSKNNLEQLLPSSKELKEMKKDGTAEKASGKELFKLINGGAGLFHKHGFMHVIAQSYTVKNAKSVNLEIYQMDSKKNAVKIYNKRGGKEGKKIPYGQNGTIKDYYCIIQRGPFFVSIVGFDSTKETIDAIIKLASVVDKKTKDFKP